MTAGRPFGLLTPRVPFVTNRDAQPLSLTRYGTPFHDVAHPQGLLFSTACTAGSRLFRIGTRHSATFFLHRV